MKSARCTNTADAKKYKLPHDLMAHWFAAKGAATLRDRYVALRFFGYKGALKAAADHELFISKFWGGVRKLYPKLADKPLNLNEYGCYVTVQP